MLRAFEESLRALEKHRQYTVIGPKARSHGSKQIRSN
jgi:hypothetical protein